VRNYKARNYLRAMKPGDQVLFYHSGEQKAVVGVMKVLSAAYPDRTAKEDLWSAVDVAPARALKNPVSLSTIKGEPSLRGIHLVRMSRLSVMPLEREQFRTILSLGGGTAAAG
jgi:predicted RNA-binding protein with PUA-like domain